MKCLSMCRLHRIQTVVSSNQQEIAAQRSKQISHLQARHQTWQKLNLKINDSERFCRQFVSLRFK